jgi:hypothetical protein
MRLFYHCVRNNCAVLKHIFKVYKVAVVHMLGKIVGVVEMDNALLVGLNNILRQQDALCNVLADLACHVVALDAVHGGVLVGVFLLYFLVVALNEGEYLVIRGVGLTDKRAGVAVFDVALCHGKCALFHDAVFDQLLNFLNGQRSLNAEADALNRPGDVHNIILGEYAALS